MSVSTFIIRVLIHAQKATLWGLGLTMLCSGCGKEKLDFSYDNTPETYETSSVRVVNLALYRQVSGPEGILTNPEGAGAPTPFFPGNGIMGRYWQVPELLFGEMGEANLTFSDLLQITPSIPVSGKSLALKLRNLDGPMDYYMIWPRGSGQPEYVRIPREETPAVKPDHFKIRLINLMKQVETLPVSGQTGAIEHLDGAITLTYADGSPVSPKTTNVPVSEGVSDYIEIPYGTYQFRILTGDGRQIAATVHGVTEEEFLYRRMDPPTSRMPVPVTNAGITGLTYAPIKTYQPGGVYSIVVSPFPFDYLVSNYYEGGYQNQFKVIEDIPAPANTRYGKVQGINTLVGERITFKVNGNPLGDALAFGAASDYRILPAGESYTVEAINSNGAVLARLDYPMEASQNHSIWLWKDARGEPQLLPVLNDLSSEFFVDRHEDNGTHNRYESTMALSTRFLNLSADVPYLSLTINNGQDMREVSQLYAQGGGHYVQHSDAVMYNLEPGEVVTDLPYARWRTDYAVLFEWMAYRSKPGVIPGVWAEDIPVFSSRDLLVNPELYTGAGRAIPSAEPGVFTLALMGRTGEVPESQKARIIAIKHNK